MFRRHAGELFRPIQFEWNVRVANLKMQFRIAVIALIAVACQGCHVGDEPEQRIRTRARVDPPNHVLQAIDFSEEFLSDRESAERRYDDKSVILVGTATFAGEDADGFVKIELEGADPAPSEGPA